VSTGTRLWFGVFTTLVFLAGVAIGLLLDRLPQPSLAPATNAMAVQGAPASGVPIGGVPIAGVPFPQPGPAGVASILADDLALTAAQRDEIAVILAAKREALGAFREHVRERFLQQRQEINAEIERVLTPAQRERFQALQRVRIDGPGPQATPDSPARPF